MLSEFKDFIRLLSLIGRLVNKKRIATVLLGVMAAVYILPLGVLRASANNDISVGGLLWTADMANWGNTISPEPGQDFRITVYALNTSLTAPVTNVIMVDQLPSRTSYMAGQAFVLDTNGAWQALADNGSSPFASGQQVSSDNILSPTESIQYKYTVHVDNFVPTNASVLSWNGPMLNFTDSFGNQAQGSIETTSITLSNVSSIQNVAVSGASFILDQAITISATGPAGKTAYAQLTTGSGVKTIPLTGSGTSYAGSYTVQAGDTIASTMPRVFFEIAAGRGSYADAPSAININATAPTPPPPSGGGGSGGSGTGSTGGAVSVFSSGGSGPSYQTMSRYMGQEDMILTVTLYSRSSATAYIKVGLVPERTNVALFEASQEAKNTSKVNDVALVGNNVYGLSAVLDTKPIADFARPARVDITYTADQLSGRDPRSFYIVRYHKANRTWKPVASVVSVDKKTVTAYLSKLDLFALAFYPEPPKITSDDDGGVVAGTRTGAYPNGTLLRVAGQAAVWRIADGKKSLVPSVDVFNSQFVWKNVIELPSDEQLRFYERTDDAGFSVGTLLKAPGSSTVYRYSQSGGKQPIVSAEVFNARGYSKSLIRMVSVETLDRLPEQDAITNANILYSGDLVKISEGPTVWQIMDDGSAHYYQDEHMFYQYVLSFRRVWTITKSRMERVADRVTKIFYPDGVLVRGSGATVYVMSDGQKRPIASVADFNALLYKWENIKVMADADLDKVPTGHEVKVIVQ